MSPYERFLRWYTGRQIPKPQPAQVTGWYPQDAPRQFPVPPQHEIDRAQARRFPPVHRATVDEAFLVRGLAAKLTAAEDTLERWLERHAGEQAEREFRKWPARTESVIHDRDGNFLPGSP